VEHIYTVAALWLGLAVISAVAAYHLRLSIALVEICVGILVAVVIASAIVPTLIAGLFFLPRHLLPVTKPPAEAVAPEEEMTEEG